MTAPVDAGVETSAGAAERPRRPLGRLRTDPGAAVALLAVALGSLHLVLRLWTAGGGWFLGPDFLAPAAAGGIAVEVPGPPGAAALARALAAVAPLSWPAAVGLEVLGQLVVDVLLYRLLVELFGRRPAALLPFAVYLTSTLPLVGGVWWSAALVQLPAQLLLLAALTGHVRHLRTARTGPALVSAVAVAVGLLFSPEMLLVPPLLAVATLLWWTEGTVGARLRAAAAHRTTWLLQAAAVAIGAGLRALVDPGPWVERTALVEAVRALPGTLSRTVLPGLGGGPLTWSPVAPTLAVPDPPAAVVWFAAVAAGAVVLGSVVLHRGAARAWGVAASAGGLLVLGAAASPAGRRDPGWLPATVVPPAALAILVALCLGLAFLPVRNAPAVLHRRRWATGQAGTRLTRPLARPAVGAAVVAVLAAWSLLSTTAFGRSWADNAARPFVVTARADLQGRSDIILFDAPVPEAVLPAALAPANRASILLAGLPRQPRFLHEGEFAYQLTTLDARGRLQFAYVDPVGTSGAGPVPDCGWVAGPDAADVPLRRATADGRWIVHVAYYAGQATVVRVQAGGTASEILTGSGVRDLYLQARGPVDHVVVEVEDPQHPICVGAVTVGTPRPVSPGGR